TDPDQVGVRAVGDYTLVFTLTHPASYFPAIAGMWVARPQPQWAIEAHRDAWTELENIVTNGPYMLTEWVHGDHLTLVKNPDWYDADQVQIEVINGPIVTDAHTALAMYEEGKLDYLGAPGWGVPSDQLDRIKADPVLSQELYILPRLCTYYYGFSTDKPPFDNPLVRRAFSAAINRQGLIDNVTKGEQQPANAFAPPGIFGNVAGDPDVAPWALDYEQGKTLAQQWLAEAGYPNGEGFPEVTLMHNTSPGHRAIAEYIAANWTEVLSVTVNITDLPWGEYLGVIAPCPSPEDKPHIWRMGWCADYPDQNNWVYEVFHSEYGANRICWHNEEFDTITSEAGAEADPERRKTLYKRAEEILCEEEAGIAPIYYYTSVLMVKPYLERYYSGLGHVYKWRIIFKVFLPIIMKQYAP
nr:peptide ABC transporter substrate-binding protein [Anaerolineae bacterium]